jgi:histidinol-phosphate aminotransferase
MSDFSRLVPEHIRKLGGYTAGKSIRQAQRESGVTCIKMASNENPFGPSPKAVAAMRACVAESNFYPDNDSQALRHKLAESHQVAPEQIVVGAGSTSLLDILARVLLGPGLNAVTSKRSFIVYPIASQAAGGTLIETPTRDDGYDLDAVAAAINRETRLVFLANPNNPTGTLAAAHEVEDFLAAVPESVVVILDEAYYDFAQYFAERRGMQYSRSLQYVRAGRNVVVLRTFSKAHGLAGVRVAYSIGPAELMQYVARMRTTFSVSLPAQAAALAALDDDAHTRKGLENNAEQAEVLLRGIAELGYHVVPTWANFLYCELGEDAAAVARRMQSEGVLIRPLGPWGCPTAMRVSIGTPEQNQIFLQSFRKVMQPTTV